MPSSSLSSSSWDTLPYTHHDLVHGNATWLLQPLPTLSKESGIVMCVGDGRDGGFAQLAYATIQTIVSLTRAKVNFEIFYMGDRDLSRKNQRLFANIPNAVLHDLSLLVNNTQLSLLGYDMKPYAALLSTFQHVMLMDADSVFLQDPRGLFDSLNYKRDGALFWHDRTLPGSIFESSSAQQVAWLKSVLPGKLPVNVAALNMIRGLSAHEMESGVVLIDKKRHTRGLMAACFMLTRDFKKHTYKWIHGDKETFWIGFASVGESFYFHPYKTSAVGVSIGNKICANQILHLDEHGTPAWMNGGLVVEKSEAKTSIGNFSEFISEPGVWTNGFLFPYGKRQGKNLCLRGKVEKFGSETTKYLEMSSRLYLRYMHEFHQYNLPL